MPMIGHRTAAGHLFGNLFHHAFDDDAEGAGISDRFGIGEDLLRFISAFAARAIAAEHIDRLRGQADMADHRNAAMGEELDGRRPSPRRPRA